MPDLSLTQRVCREFWIDLSQELFGAGIIVLGDTASGQETDRNMPHENRADLLGLTQRGFPMGTRGSQIAHIGGDASPCQKSAIAPLGMFQLRCQFIARLSVG